MSKEETAWVDAQAVRVVLYCRRCTSDVEATYSYRLSFWSFTSLPGDDHGSCVLIWQVVSQPNALELVEIRRAG